MIRRPRVKFSASINSNGDIVVGDAAPNYTLPMGGEPYCYLLENADGGYEVGTNRPDSASGSRRTPAYEWSSSVAQNEASGLTCTLIASPSAYVNTSGNQYNGVPAMMQNNMLDSTAVGAGAKTVNYNVAGARMGVALGNNAECQSQYGTALGGDTIARRNGTAIGYGARTTQPGEIQLGNSSNSHHTYLPVRANNAGDTIGTFPLFGIEGYQVLDQIDVLKPLEMQRVDIRVQGTIAVMNDADAQATRKVFNLDYMFAYPYGGAALVLLYQNITTIYAGGSAVNVSITLNASSKLPEITVSSVLGSMVCVGLLTITKLCY